MDFPFLRIILKRFVRNYVYVFVGWAQLLLEAIAQYRKKE